MRLGVLTLVVAGLLQSCGVGVGSEQSASSTPEQGSGRLFVLGSGEFWTFPRGDAKPAILRRLPNPGQGDRRAVPPPDTGVSRDPVYVRTRADGTVRAECGGVHAETAPPGSW